MDKEPPSDETFQDLKEEVRKLRTIMDGRVLIDSRPSFDELRREVALAAAIKSHQRDPFKPAEGVFLKRAKEFEAYLKGDSN